MLTSICGINWGDEGKGRMVDLLSRDFDIVCRYQGGNNAGHTVINERGKFILNLLPSGILREEVVNILGCGMVIDLKHLCGEIEKLRSAGIKITPENLKISDKAVITMPYNVLQDVMEEDRLSKATGKPYGSTRRGIAPVYADKYMKKAFRMGELLNTKLMFRRLPDIVAWKNLTVTAYGYDPVKVEDMEDYFRTYGEPLKEFITDTGVYLNEAHKAGKKIMFEAQLGALRDIDYGIVPYTSSSSTIAAYASLLIGYFLYDKKSRADRALRKKSNDYSQTRQRGTFQDTCPKSHSLQGQPCRSYKLLLPLLPTPEIWSDRGCTVPHPPGNGQISLPSAESFRFPCAQIP